MNSIPHKNATISDQPHMFSIVNQSRSHRGAKLATLVQWGYCPVVELLHRKCHNRSSSVTLSSLFSKYASAAQIQDSSIFLISAVSFYKLYVVSYLKRLRVKKSWQFSGKVDGTPVSAYGGHCVARSHIRLSAICSLFQGLALLKIYGCNV